MCYDGNARPPVPEGAAGPAHGEDPVLQAADGNRFAACISSTRILRCPLSPSTRRGSLQISASKL